MSGKSKELSEYGGDLEDQLLSRRARSAKRRSTRRLRDEPSQSSLQTAYAEPRSDRSEGYVSGGSRRSRRRWTRSRRQTRAQRRGPGTTGVPAAPPPGVPAAPVPAGETAKWSPGIDDEKPNDDGAVSAGYWPSTEGALAPQEVTSTSVRASSQPSPTSSASSSVASAPGGNVAVSSKNARGVLDAIAQQTSWRPGLVLPSALANPDASNPLAALRGVASNDSLLEEDEEETDQEDLLASTGDLDDESGSSASSSRSSSSSGSSDGGGPDTSYDQGVVEDGDAQTADHPSEEDSVGPHPEAGPAARRGLHPLGASASAPIPIPSNNRHRSRENLGAAAIPEDDALLISRASQSPYGSLGSGPESTRLGQIDVSGDASALLVNQKDLARRRRAAGAAASRGGLGPGASGRSRLARREAKNIIREWRNSRTLVSVELSLRNRGLTSIPGLRDLARDEIANKRLGILDFDHNGLKKLPSHILSLVNLTELHVDYNQLTEKSFPPNMTPLRSLTLLSASHNHIREFPRAFVTLPSLEYLDLRDNDLERLVPEHDADQFITDLFGSLGKTLKSLDLGMNNLQGTLDVRFCEGILKIEQLSLHTNQLTAFPECFKFMDRLRVLRANGNLLLQVPPLSVVSSGPAAVRKFFHSLSKGNAPSLEDGPGERSRASSGGSLTFSPRDFPGAEDADVGDSASLADGLGIERLNSNSSSSSSVFAEVGILHQEQQSKISPSAEATPESLAPQRGEGTPSPPSDRIAKLAGSAVGAAPAPSDESVSRGLVAGRSDSTQVAQQRRNFKVVVLGNSEAGKTSLIKTLMSGCSGTSESEDRTFGVDIHSMELPDASRDASVETLTMWDFAGQSVYYRTHQIFLSRRTLYLLVWDVTKHSQAQLDMEVCFWVYSVQARIPGAVIQIIASKTDLVTPEVLAQRKRELRERLNQHETWRKRDLADMAREEELEESATEIGDIASTMSVVSTKTSSTRLRRRALGWPNVDTQSQTVLNKDGLEEDVDDYHELRPRILLRQRPRVLEDIVDVSSETGKGFDNLRARLMEVVRDAKLFPHVGSLACIPLAWTVVEDAIGRLRKERQSRPVCSWAELEAAVAACSEEFGLEIVESGDIVQCIQFLNDIGHIVYNRSVDMVVLDPNWIVDCIKRIVDHQSIDKRLMEKLASHNTNQSSARRVARMRLVASAGANSGAASSPPLSRQTSTSSARSVGTAEMAKRGARARRKLDHDGKIVGDVKKLKAKGILSESLLKCLWHELFARDRSKDQQAKDEAIYEGLVHILEQFDVCSSLARSSTGERQWIIPCLITKSIDIERRWSRPGPAHDAIQIGRSFVFPRFKPPGLMAKILTTVSKLFPQSEAEIRTWRDATLIHLFSNEGPPVKLLIRQKQERVFSSSMRAANAGQGGSDDDAEEEAAFDMERAVLDLCALGSPQTALHKMWYTLGILQDAIEEILIYEYMGITWFYMVRCPKCIAHLSMEDDFSAAHAFDIRDVEEKQDRQADLIEQNWRDYFGALSKKQSGELSPSSTRRKTALCQTMCDTESKRIPSHECPLMWLVPPPPEIEDEFMSSESDAKTEAEEEEEEEGAARARPSMLPDTGYTAEEARALVTRTIDGARELAHEMGQSNQRRTLVSAPIPVMSRPHVPPGVRQVSPELADAAMSPWSTNGAHGGPVIEDYGLALSIRPDQHLLQLQSGYMLDARSIVRIGVYCNERRRFLESGSGFVMDRARGLIVTACHLVTDPKTCTRKFSFGPQSTKRIIVALFSSQDSLPVWQFRASIVVAGDARARSQPPSFATGARVTGSAKARSAFLDLLVLRLDGQVHETFNSTGLENSVWGTQVTFEPGPPIEEALPLPADLAIADSSLLNIGDSVALIGFPLSRGAAETICMDKGSVQGFSERRAFINAALFNLAGSSGGPLINERGEVVGVLSTAVSNTLGVHVAINRIIPLLEQVYSYVTVAAHNSLAILEQQREQQQAAATARN